MSHKTIIIIEIIILIAIIIGVITLLNNKFVRPLTLDVYVGIAALVISVVALWLSLQFYFKTDELFKKTLVHLAKIEVISTGAYKDMFGIVKSAWEKMTGAPDLKGKEGTQQLISGIEEPIMTTVPTTFVRPKDKEAKITLDEKERKELEGKIINYIKKKGLIVAYEILREFTDLFGKNDDEQINNTMAILKDMKDRGLIYYFKSGYARPNTPVVLLKPEK